MTKRQLVGPPVQLQPSQPSQPSAKRLVGKQTVQQPVQVDNDNAVNGDKAIGDVGEDVGQSIVCKDPPDPNNSKPLGAPLALPLTVGAVDLPWWIAWMEDAFGAPPFPCAGSALGQINNDIVVETNMYKPFESRHAALHARTTPAPPQRSQKAEAPAQRSLKSTAVALSSGQRRRPRSTSPCIVRSRLRFPPESFATPDRTPPMGRGRRNIMIDERCFSPVPRILEHEYQLGVDGSWIRSCNLM